MTTLLLASAGFTACSSSDGDNNNGSDVSLNGGENLETPAYEDVSALYEVQDDMSKIRSVELTASGDYIIQMGGGTPPKAPKRFAGSKFLAEYVYRPNIIYGRYTKTSENQFNLENWGTITVNGTSSITLTPNGSDDPITVPVAKKTQYPSNDLTNKLCRTWNFSSFRYILIIGDKQVHNKEYSSSEAGYQQFATDLKALGKKYAYIFDDDDEMYVKANRAHDDDDDDDDEFDIDDIEMPEYIIFTKAGSYMVYYNEFRLGVATWTWEDLSTGLVGYSWNYGGAMDGRHSGEVNIGFRKDQLAVTELVDPEEGDEGFEEKVIWYLDEKK